MDNLFDFADDVSGINQGALAGDAAPESQHLFHEARAALDVGFQNAQQLLPVVIGDFFL